MVDHAWTDPRDWDTGDTIDEISMDQLGDAIWHDRERGDRLMTIGGTATAVGYVAQQDTGAADKIALISTAGQWTGRLWVAQQIISASGTGYFRAYGVSEVYREAAVAIGDYLTTSTTAGKAAVGTVYNSFARALTSKSSGAGTVKALLRALPDGLPGTHVHKIAETTLGAGAANIDLQSLPTIYKAWRVLATLRGDTAAATTGVFLRLNNDSGANYYYESLVVSAATATASETLGSSSLACGAMPAASASSANMWGSLEVLLGNVSAAVEKSADATTRRMSNTTSGNVVREQHAGFWRNTAAVNRLTLIPGAGNFATGSTVAVYGIP